MAVISGIDYGSTARVDRNKSARVKAVDASWQHGIISSLRPRATKLGMTWLHCEPAQMHSCVPQSASSMSKLSSAVQGM